MHSVMEWRCKIVLHKGEASKKYLLFAKRHQSIYYTCSEDQATAKYDLQLMTEEHSWESNTEKSRTHKKK